MQTETHWAATAAAIEARIEGDRLIALEIGAALTKAWHAMLHWLAVTADATAAARHLPPV
jgi:hypothetical protein